MVKEREGRPATRWGEKGHMYYREGYWTFVPEKYEKRDHRKR